MSGRLNTVQLCAIPLRPTHRTLGCGAARSLCHPEAALTDERSAPTPLDLEQQVCFGLSIAARGVVAAYRPLLEPLGLTHPQYLVMVALWQHGSQSVKELGGLLTLDSGTLSPLLKRLEVMGLVRRGREPRDERRVVVQLTAQGERLREEAEVVHERVVERLGLAPEELERLQTVLTRLIDATTRPVPAR